MLSVRLPDDIEQRLSTIAELEHTTKTEIVRSAIMFYIEKLQEEKKQTSYTLGKDLFGVYEGDENLSINCKQKLQSILDEKYNHH